MRRRRAGARGAWQALGVCVVAGGAVGVWRNVNHWLIFAGVLCLAGVLVMVWVWMLRRRQRTWLYEYDHATQPGRRYIGITNNPKVRAAGHRDRSWWYGSSTGQMRLVRCYPSAAAAGLAETLAIEAAALAGEPIANDRKVPRHIRQQRIAQHTRGVAHE